MISERSTGNLSAPTPVARRGPLGEALTSESIKEKEKLEPSAVETVPFTLLRRICTPVVLITRSQLAIFASITVFGALFTQEPVYAVSAVPVGTPVFAAFGKPPGTGAGGGGVVGVGGLSEGVALASDAVTTTATMAAATSARTNRNLDTPRSFASFGHSSTACRPVPR